MSQISDTIRAQFKAGDDIRDAGLISPDTIRARFTFAPPEAFVPAVIAINCGANEVQLSDDPADLTSLLMADYLPHVFHCNMRSEDARRCNDGGCRFFKRFV